MKNADLWAYGSAGLLVGLLRLELLRQIGGFLGDGGGLLSLGLPVGVTALAVVYAAGAAFFNRGPERGLLRLAIFVIAAMSGSLLAMP